MNTQDKNSSFIKKEKQDALEMIGVERNIRIQRVNGQSGKPSVRAYKDQQKGQAKST
jgi:hypothetical protein